MSFQGAVVFINTGNARPYYEAVRSYPNDRGSEKVFNLNSQSSTLTRNLRDGNLAVTTLGHTSRSMKVLFQRWAQRLSSRLMSQRRLCRALLLAVGLTGVAALPAYANSTNIFVTTDNTQ